MDWFAIGWSGFVATTLTAAYFWAIRAFGWTRFSPTVQLGCIFSRDPNHPVTETLGFVLLFVLGSTAVPAIYDSIFTRWTGISWVAGVGVGTLFGIATVAALPVLGTISACVRSG